MDNTLLWVAVLSRDGTPKVYGPYADYDARHLRRALEISVQPGERVTIPFYALTAENAAQVAKFFLPRE